MNIDELEWPDDAEVYIKPRANNEVAGPFFARTCDSDISGGKVGIKISGEAYYVYETYWEVINRPTKAWEDGIPPEETECEVAVLDDGDYMWCLIKAIRGGDAWITTKNSDIVIRTDFAIFRPLQPTVREKLIEIMKDEIRGKIELCPWEALADVILESFDLTEKKK